MINVENFYKTIYKALDHVTPINSDCGKLCGSACCSSNDSGSGMYLYPGEDKYIRYKKWGKVFDSDFIVDGRKTPFIICDGKCVRGMRPLACRIFPLVPYVSPNGDKSLILDPRGATLCPLLNVTPEFYRRVFAVSSLLWKIGEMRTFLHAQARLIDDSVMPF